MKFALVLFPLLMAGSIKQPVEVTTTEKVEFAPGGTIRFEGSVGQLNIESWDRPEVEITFTRYTYSGGTEPATTEMNKIKMTTKRVGSELQIITELPSRNFFARWFDGKTKWDLDYRIKVPRDAKLVIRHDGGDLSVYDVVGDIQARADHGTISLLLPKAEYAIDARCSFGDVYSDFATTANSAHKIDLRVGHGGIKILQITR